MEDNLKYFIQNNREQLDIYLPSPGLWDQLNLRIDQAASGGWASGFTGWKGLSFLSVPIVATALYFSVSRNADQPAVPEQPPVIEENMPIVKESVKEDSVVLHEVIEQEIPAEVPNRQIVIETPANPLEEEVVAPVPSAVSPVLPEMTYEFPSPEAPVPQPVEVEIPAPAVVTGAGLPVQKNMIRVNKSKDELSIRIDTVFNDVKKLEIEGSFCNVNIRQTERENMRITGEIRVEVGGIHSKMDEDDYDLHYEKEGSLLKVQVNCKGKVVMLGGSFNRTALLEFDLPSQVSEVVVNNSSGDVNIDHFRGEHLNVHSVSGDIDAKHVSADVSLKSSSGDISLSEGAGNITTVSVSGDQEHHALKGPLTVKSSSGDIEVEQLEGDLSAKTVSGSQEYREINGNVSTSSSSGRINISGCTGNVTSSSVSGSQSFSRMQGDVQSNSSSGSVTVTGIEGNLSVSTVSGSITGEEVKAGDHLSFQSSSGSIRMGLLNKANELSLDLESSSGNIVVEKEGLSQRSKGSVKVKGGNISVKSRTVSGSQHFK